MRCKPGNGWINGFYLRHELAIRVLKCSAISYLTARFRIKRSLVENEFRVFAGLNGIHLLLIRHQREHLGHGVKLRITKEFRAAVHP